MSTVKWSDPPVRKSAGRVSRWSVIADELRVNPNRWALIAENVATSTSGALRSGSAAGFTRGDFEVRSVSIPDSATPRSDIYARFVGAVTS